MLLRNLSGVRARVRAGPVDRSRLLPSARLGARNRTTATASRIHTHLVGRRLPQRPVSAGSCPTRRAASGTRTPFADEKIEEITEQYSTAKDEFEIAVEETEKKTVYAADDRAAAAAELAKLKEMFERAVDEAPSSDIAAEIRQRAGQRVKELDMAVRGLEESAREGV